ncbi:MAG: hypothetical protein M0Q92_06045 [Methanoregula sp.]|jgi:hypothetical protein|nr:hypothetical protein [Methanoregula sp.]
MMSVKCIPVIPLVIVGLILLITPCAAGFHAQTSSNIALAKGDSMTITGTGAMNGSVAIWGIGSSFFTYVVVPAAPDGTINWTLGRDVTRTFRSGPLMIIVQDPGQDRQYSLRAAMSEEKNYVILENGMGLFEGEQNFLNISAAIDLSDRLRDEMTDGYTDDSYTLLTTFVEEPSIHFQQGDPDESLTVVTGDHVMFSGTMNMAPKNRIMVRIEDTSVIEKTGLRIPARTETITAIRTGEQQNQWEYNLDTTGLNPGEYLFEIGWDQSLVSGQNAMVFRITPQRGKASLAPDNGSGGTMGRITFSPFFSLGHSGGLPDIAGGNSWRIGP